RVSEVKAITVLKSFIAIGSTAAMLAVPASASAHFGDASGKCVNNNGVITVNFHSFGEKLFGTILVDIDGKQVESIKPTVADFSKTYQPFSDGKHTVKASWAIDKNNNGKADNDEFFGFT